MKRPQKACGSFDSQFTNKQERDHVMNSKILVETEKYVRQQLSNDPTGHDWYHIDRVRKLALTIWEEEKIGDPWTIEMVALLHDISDEKLNESKEAGNRKLRHFLETLNMSRQLIEQLIEMINSISFGRGNRPKPTSIEAQIVQDADRLDAIGAIGIARTFAYGGSKGRSIYEPSATEERNSSTIQHFYDKLLKVKALMNTESAKKIAVERHEFMDRFLEQFFKEWNGLK